MNRLEMIKNNERKQLWKYINHIAREYKRKFGCTVHAVQLVLYRYKVLEGLHVEKWNTCTQATYNNMVSAIIFNVYYTNKYYRKGATL